VSIQMRMSSVTV